MSKILPQTLRTLRERAGISRETLAQALDVTPITVYRWEKGQVRIQAKYLPGICCLLDCTEAALAEETAKGYDVEQLRQELGKLVSATQLNHGGDAIYWKQCKTLRSASKMLLDLIELSRDVSESHQNDAVFTEKEHMESLIPEIEF